MECVLVQSEGNKVAYCAVTVDNCFVAMTEKVKTGSIRSD